MRIISSYPNNTTVVNLDYVEKHTVFLSTDGNPQITFYMNSGSITYWNYPKGDPRAEADAENILKLLKVVHLGMKVQRYS